MFPSRACCEQHSFGLFAIHLKRLILDIHCLLGCLARAQKSVRAGKQSVILDIPSRVGKKGSDYMCMQPSFTSMSTFTHATVTVGAPSIDSAHVLRIAWCASQITCITARLQGPVPPPLEIYGVARDIAVDESTKQRVGTHGASSLVMF